MRCMCIKANWEVRFIIFYFLYTQVKKQDHNVNEIGLLRLLEKPINFRDIRKHYQNIRRKK